jgi:hypothetical protein
MGLADEATTVSRRTIVQPPPCPSDDSMKLATIPG